MSYTDNFFALRKKKKDEEENAPKRDKLGNLSFNGAIAALDKADIAPVVDPTAIMLSKPSDIAVKNSDIERNNRQLEAPTKSTWFEGGAFKDGYQFGDVLKSLNATAIDTTENVLAGMLSIGETTADALSSVVGGVAGALGNKDLQSRIRQTVEGDLINEETVAKKIMHGMNIVNPAYYLAGGEKASNNSLFGEKADSLAQSAGQLLDTVALQAAGVPWWLTTGVTSFGANAESTLREDATYGEAMASSAISTAGELLTEKLFGGSGLGEKGLINLEPLTKGITNKVVKSLVDFGINMGSEGFEETVSSVIGNLGSALYREENMWDILTDENAVDEYITSFVGGMVLGGGMNAGKVTNSVKTGTDYHTGVTANEQKVIDAEIKNRIAEEEADGKELTSKQKKAIEEQVYRDMEKGYLSTDTIESVLGGGAYKAYQDAVNKENSVAEQEKAINDEISELVKTPESQFTIEQRERLTELREQLKTLDKTSNKAELKTKLGEDTLNILKGERKGKGSLLIESYNEQTRRGQVFTADISKYDAKQQAVIQKAIDSGILNNTNKTHDFVDMIAKISADKGVSFDFADNAKLKESGFALDGKTINGFVNKDGVTLNIDSHKALNKVVGHEITHVLEGTELYTELQNTLFEYAKSKGEYDSRLASLTELYKGVKDADVNAELTADLVGDYLFTDSDYITHLSTTNRNVFQKIYDEVKYLYSIATAGSKEARELEKLKHTFEKAYKESGKATSGTTRFSLSKPIEETKDLLVLHNITENKLLKQLDLDGFPMPSLAVTNQPHTNFGSISILFNKDTIDPKKDKKNKTYSADAWTPTFPRIEYETDSAVESSFFEAIESLIDNDHYRDGTRTFSYDIEDVLNRNGGYDGLIDYLAEKPSVQYAFLKSKGESVDIAQKQKEIPLGFSTDERWISRYEGLIADFGGDISSLGKIPYNELIEQSPTIKNLLERLPMKSPARQIDIISKLIDGAQAYQSYNPNSETKAEYIPDYAQTDKDMQERIDANELKEWLRGQTKGIVANSGVYNGKEIFTPSGNRRSFQQLHYPVTVENIVKSMAAQGEKSVTSFHGVKTLRATTAKTFKSIAEIQKAKGKLQNLSEAEVNQIHDELSTQMYEVFNKIIDENPKMFRKDDIFARDTIGEVLSEVEYENINASYIKGVFNKYGYNLSSETADDCFKLLDAISSMPVYIFEAKPQRVVGYDEIKAVVIPDSTSTELKNALTQRGISFIEYDGTESDRQAKLNEVATANDSYFSLSAEGEAPKRNSNDVYGEDIRLKKAPTEESVIAPLPSTATKANTMENGVDNSIRVYRGFNKSKTASEKNLTPNKSVYDYIGKSNHNEINDLVPLAYYTESQEDARSYADMDKRLLEIYRQNGIREYRQKIMDGKDVGGVSETEYAEKAALSTFRSLHGGEPNLNGYSESYDYTPGKVLDLTSLGSETNIDSAYKLLAEMLGTSEDDVERSLMIQNALDEDFSTFRLLRNTPTNNLGTALVELAKKAGYESIRYIEDGNSHYAIINDVEGWDGKLVKATDTLDEFAPITEDEANAMASESLDSLTDADVPPEFDAPYYGESEEVTADDPFENRDIKEVGNRKVKAYMYENPEVKPFFQAEARTMLGDLERGIKGERYYVETPDGRPGVYGSDSYGYFDGTKRLAHPDIEYLLDECHYTYKQIEDGLNAIIEDHGAENNAVSKRIEFLINDRLLNGTVELNTFGGALDIPPNQDYINLLNEKQITEYNEEAKRRFFEVADDYAPIAEAPVAETKVSEAPIKEAPIAEAYEAIRPPRGNTEPRMTEAEPRMKRVDSTNNAPDGMEERSWVGTSTGSEAVDGIITPDDIPDDVRYYQVKSNKKTLETANARLARDGYAKSREYFEGRMSERKLTVEDIALGERLIQEAAKAGDAQAVRDLIIDVSILGTELGQRVQALSMIRRLTPEGQLKALIRTVERGKAKGDKAFDGVEVTEDMVKQITDTIKEDGTFDQAELDAAVEDVKQQIADQMSVSFMDKVNAWRYLSMLGNPKTHIRNLVSNIAMMGTRAVKNIVARTAEDIALRNKKPTLNTEAPKTEKFTAPMRQVMPAGTMVKAADRDNIGTIQSFNPQTGKYTVYFKSPSGHTATVKLDANILKPLNPTKQNRGKTADGSANGGEDIAPIHSRTKTWKRATEAVKAFAKTTTTEMESTIKGDNKYSDEGSLRAKRKVFNTKAINAVNNANTKAMEWEDAIFSKHAFQTTLQEYLTANGIKTEEDIKNNPELVAKAKEYALEESRKATFRQDSYIANKIGEIERKNPIYGLAIGSTMPFKRTPINIAKTGAAYSPLGFARNIYDFVQVAKGNKDASEAIDHLAQTLTGTSLALIGYALASSGVLNGAGDDDKEGKYDYQLGKQSYSFNFGGDTYSLNWLSPVAMPLFVGANAYETLVEKNEWDMNVVIDTLGQTLDPMSEMSFISSLDDVLSSYDSGIAKIWGAGESMVQNYATQFIPTLSSQVASLTDDTKRSTKPSRDSGFTFGEETLNKIKYKIPGLRNTLEPTTDIWGNEAKQTEKVVARGFESFLSPANKRAGIATAVDDELKALYSEVGKAEILPAIPYNYIDYKGAKYDMSAKDHTEYKQTYGQTAYELMQDLFDTKTYKNASAEEKADMVADVYDYARDAAKKEYFAKRGVDFTNSTITDEDTGVKTDVFKENPIKGSISYDLPVDEYTFLKEYPKKYLFFKDNGISYSDYKNANEDGKRAYSWAYDNPEKYTVSKAVTGDLLTYRKLTGDLYDIKADKDANGKSISGSRKDKVADYINGLDLDYGEKLILFKNEYNADDTYNYEIVDYLNGRDDISYEDTVIILKELGFDVDSNGYVTWD